MLRNGELGHRLQYTYWQVFETCITASISKQGGHTCIYSKDYYSTHEDSDLLGGNAESLGEQFLTFRTNNMASHLRKFESSIPSLREYHFSHYYIYIFIVQAY
jgi:hypothetical protein